MSQHDTLTLEQAVFAVLEGFTLPHDVRKVLEAAYYNRSALSATQPAQAAQGEPVKPLFAAKIAARKWDELQEQGARMQSIAFDGHKSGQPGTIDPWGVVMWQAAQGAGEVDTGPRVLREVLSVCEDTMDKMALETTEFSRGRAFEAKGISRAIGTWFQDEFCGLSHMGEPVAAPTQPAAGADVLDAQRYRMVRRGQHWSVINGIGDTLRGEDLDAAIDAVSVGQR